MLNMMTSHMAQNTQRLDLVLEIMRPSDTSSIQLMGTHVRLSLICICSSVFMNSPWRWGGKFRTPFMMAMLRGGNKRRQQDYGAGRRAPKEATVRGKGVKPLPLV